ncbi:hypothetical protein ACRAWD_21885, partial [Caulobacter segnis]
MLDAGRPGRGRHRGLGEDEGGDGLSAVRAVGRRRRGRAHRLGDEAVVLGLVACRAGGRRAST